MCASNETRSFKAGFQRNVPYLLQTHDHKKREEKSPGFGLIQLRTVYNFCTIDQRVAKVESVGIKLQETTCFQCGTRNIGKLLRKWKGTKIVYTGKKTKLETVNVN